MIYWGFIVLQVRTLNFLLKGVSEDISLEHLGGIFYDVLVRAPMDMFNILVLIGCAHGGVAAPVLEARAHDASTWTPGSSSSSSPS